MGSVFRDALRHRQALIRDARRHEQQMERIEARSSSSSPQVVAPPAVSPEQMRRRRELKREAAELAEVVRKRDQEWRDAWAAAYPNTGDTVWESDRTVARFWTAVSSLGALGMIPLFASWAADDVVTSERYHWYAAVIWALLIVPCVWLSVQLVKETKQRLGHKRAGNQAINPCGEHAWRIHPNAKEIRLIRAAIDTAPESMDSERFGELPAVLRTSIELKSLENPDHWPFGVRVPPEAESLLVQWREGKRR